MDLVETIRSNGPISPATQLRALLAACKIRGWNFDTAWKWSWERIKWPHDTTTRRGYKRFMGENPTDPRREAVLHRECWRRAYDGQDPLPRERSAGLISV